MTVDTVRNKYLCVSRLSFFFLCVCFCGERGLFACVAKKMVLILIDSFFDGDKNVIN